MQDSRRGVTRREVRAVGSAVSGIVIAAKRGEGRKHRLLRCNTNGRLRESVPNVYSLRQLCGACRRLMIAERYRHGLRSALCQYSVSFFRGVLYSRPATGPRRTLVLIVGSNVAEREMYAMGLRHLDLDTVQVSTPHKALRVAASIRPDVVVVTELGFPGALSNCELIRRVKEDTHSPVICLTWLHHERARAMEAGCSKFIVKPRLPHVLADDIHGVLAGGVVSPDLIDGGVE